MNSYLLHKDADWVMFKRLDCIKFDGTMCNARYSLSLASSGSDVSTKPFNDIHWWPFAYILSFVSACSQAIVGSNPFNFGCFFTKLCERTWNWKSGRTSSLRWVDANKSIQAIWGNRLQTNKTVKIVQREIHKYSDASEVDFFLGEIQLRHVT